MCVCVCTFLILSPHYPLYHTTGPLPPPKVPFLPPCDTHAYRYTTYVNLNSTLETCPIVFPHNSLIALSPSC